MKLGFVTTNKHKVREMQLIFGESIELEQIDFDYPELRSDDPEEIVHDAIVGLIKKYKRPIIIEDSGLFISSLKEFPGTCSAYVHKRIGLEGILTLMEDVEARTCSYISAIGYGEPGGNPVSFLGEEKGTIAKSIKGNKGFGHDPIFIPEGSEKTYGEMDDVEDVKKFRRRAIVQLITFLKKYGKIR